MALMAPPSRQGLLEAPNSAGGSNFVVGAATPVAEDHFFAGELGLIATFDFDYEKIIAFDTSLRWAQFIFCPCTWFSTICCVPCFINQNVEWAARAQHVTLTVDGIRYVTEKRKALCGLQCTDRGKESKTIPYDKITDCDVQEPAGTACCCCIQNVLSTINVDTASSGASKEGLPRHELVLRGLKYPLEFKQAVWSMKRGHAPTNAAVPLDPVRARELAVAPQQAEMNTAILLEIRDELRQMNALLSAKS